MLVGCKVFRKMQSKVLPLGPALAIPGLGLAISGLGVAIPGLSVANRDTTRLDRCHALSPIRPIDIAPTADLGTDRR